MIFKNKYKTNAIDQIVCMIKHTNGYQVRVRSLNVGLMEVIIRNHCDGYHVMCVRLWVHVNINIT